ncbi:hypothetical protein BKI52_01855 [marine bacterium AO1-C]|nr:hypothetical protein BKI52_01855 [marine bacterium AO1-C]
MRNYPSQIFILALWLFCVACSQKKEQANGSKHNREVTTKSSKDSLPSNKSPQSKPEINCKVNSLEELKGKAAYNNVELKKAYKQAAIFELSPKHKYLVYGDNNLLKVYDLSSDKSFVLEENLGNKVKFSRLQWSKSEEMVAFVLIASKNIPQMRVIKIKNRQVISRKSLPIKTVTFQEKEGCPQNIDVNFWIESKEPTISYQCTEMGMSYRYIYLSETPLQYPLNVVAQGLQVNREIYGVVDEKYEEIDLPQKIKESLKLSFIRPQVTPNPLELIYSGSDSKSDSFLIKTYEVDTQKEKVLIKLPAERDGISSIIWSPNEQLFAFVDVDQDGYKMGTKLYVYHLESGKVSLFDAPINFMCGASCYVHAGEDFLFKDDKTITYLKHKMKNEGKEEMININIEN